MKRVIGRHKDGKRWMSVKLHDGELSKLIKLLGGEYEFVEVGVLIFFVSWHFSQEFSYQFGSKVDYA